MAIGGTLKRLGIVAATFGGLVIASFAQLVPAQAQTGVGDNDQPESLQELQPVPSNDGDRAARLRTLQQGVLIRNAATQSPASSGIPSTSTVSPISPAQEQEAAIAVVKPVGNQLSSVSLTNDTGTTVTYQVIGDTTRRMLMMDESAMLQGIPLPATITVVRQDEGLVGISATSSEDGI